MKLTVQRSYLKTPNHAFILVVILVLLSACSVSEPVWFKNLEEARHLCVLGKLSESQAILNETEKSITKDGDCPQPYISPGRVSPTTYTGELASLSDCLSFHGLYPQAESLAHRAIDIAERNPKNTSILAPLRALALTFEEQKKYKDAEAIRTRIVARSDSSLQDLYQLGDLYVLENKLSEAKISYEKAVAIEEKQTVKFPSLSEHLNKLGRYYFLAGDFKNAEKIYQKALNFEPTSLENERGDSYSAKDLRPLADLYRAEGELTKAEVFYRHSLSGNLGYTNKEESEILTSYAQLLRQMHRISEAEMREAQAKKKAAADAQSERSYTPQVFE
jgi:tetratricopeptide (TPR) repeat protein